MRLNSCRQRLGEFLELQQRNNRIIYNALKAVPGISFRVIPDPSGDTGSFLSFFLPTEEMTRKAVSALVEAGIGGNFYWYDNNWHYIRKWQHLQNGNFMSRLPEEQKKQVMHYSNMAYPVSDAIMSRCISSSISLLWSEEQAKERGEKMAAILKGVVEKNVVNI